MKEVGHASTRLFKKLNEGGGACEHETFFLRSGACEHVKHTHIHMKEVGSEHVFLSTYNISPPSFAKAAGRSDSLDTTCHCRCHLVLRFATTERLSQHVLKICHRGLRNKMVGFN